MSNPYFNNDPVFKQGGNGLATASRTPAGYPTLPGYQPGYQTGATQNQAANQYQNAYGQAPAGYGTQSGYGQVPAGYDQVPPQQVSDLEASYGAPAAGNVDRGRMTYDDVIIRTAGIFAVIVAVGTLSWVLATTPATAGLGVLAMVVGAIGSLVMGLVSSFKRVPSPACIMLYAVFEGAMLGAFSGTMEALYDGVVIQAVLATAATFAVMLCAYKVAGFRVRGRVARILMVAMGGYLLFSLVNFGLMMTGVLPGWGLRSVTVMGIPLGVIVGVLAVVMAAVSLAMDFESIQRGVERGAPKVYAWAGAFGLVVTLVWLYVEFLRILTILREN